MRNGTNALSDGRSLPGFRKKSFVLPYAGGEIWFEHLDGIREHSALAEEKLAADTPLFSRPSMPAYIAFVLDETRVSEALIRQIARALTAGEKRFLRVAVIGLQGFRNRQRLRRALDGHGMAVAFFDGIEPAKEWLMAAGR